MYYDGFEIFLLLSASVLLFFISILQIFAWIYLIRKYFAYQKYERKENSGN
jgi:hypothetical protein